MQTSKLTRSVRRSLPLVAVPLGLFGCGEADSGDVTSMDAVGGASSSPTGGEMSPMPPAPGAGPGALGGMAPMGEAGGPAAMPEIGGAPGVGGGAPTGGAGGAAADPDNQPPTAAFTVSRDPADGTKLQFDGSASEDPDGEVVTFSWKFGEIATGEGMTIDQDFESDGCIDVTLTVVDDKGAMATHQATVAVTSQSANGASGAQLDPLPRDFSLIARDIATNEGTVVVSGKSVAPGFHTVEARVTNDDGVTEVHSGAVCGGDFSFPAAIPAVLSNHKLEVSLLGAAAPESLGVANDLIAGDVIIIQGQSNAVARKQRPDAGDSNVNKTPFLRSFGNHGANGGQVANDNTWYVAVGDEGTGAGAIGQWGIRMGAVLVERFKIPLAIMNHGNGGKAIGFFQRNDGNPGDTSNNYGRLYSRMQRSGLAGAVRTILFYQGESDNTAQQHVNGYRSLQEDWLEDYPTTEHFYATQIRRGCGNPNFEFHEAQRRFPETFENTSVMTVHGLDGHDDCHFDFNNGYKELGEWYAGLLGRDLFGAPAEPDTEAVDVGRATLDGNTIRIEIASDASALNVDNGVAGDFSLAGTQRNITDVKADGTTLVLTLSGGNGAPTRVRYSGHKGRNGGWVTNAKGIGMLAFDIEI